jgi:sugar phosphate isomerase/epimerase
MSRFGAHAFIWRSEWTPAAARAVIEGAAAAGLDFVEIPLLRPAEFDAAGTRRSSTRTASAPPARWGCPTDAALPGDPAGAERFLRHAVEVVAAVGSPVLTGVIYGTLGAQVGRRRPTPTTTSSRPRSSASRATRRRRACRSASSRSTATRRSSSTRPTRAST